MFNRQNTLIISKKREEEGMLSNKELVEIVKGLSVGAEKHSLHKESVGVATAISETFSEEYPKWMNIQRPKEQKGIKEYRKAIFSNPMTGEATRIIDKYTKIEQSEGFSVTYPKQSTEKNELEEYCDNDFFGYNTLVNYVFTSVVNRMNYDPNGVLAVLDKEPSMLETDTRKPFPYMFSSERVLEYKSNKYCVLLDENDNIGERIFYILDDTFYYVVNENNNNTGLGYSITQVKHHCGVVPAFKIGQFISKETKGERLYKSILTDTLTHFRSAIRRYNDAEAELITHINSKEWSISPKNCTNCKGNKYKRNEKGEQVECPSCNGKGVETWDFGNELLIKAEEANTLFGDGKFPFPSPGGVIERNIAALKAIQESYTLSVDEAYGAIDFSVLRDRRSNRAESGESKRMDRLEYSQKIYSAARHIVENVLIPAYRYIDAQLFGVNEGQVGKRLPEVTTPIEFDIMSPDTLLEDMKLAKEAGMAPEIIAALAIKYAKIVVGDNGKETKMLVDQVTLDPLYGKSTDEIELLMGGGDDSPASVVARIDVILSVNFKGLHDRAIREEKDWDAFDNTKKYDTLLSYAQEILDKKAEAGETVKTIETLKSTEIEDVEQEDETLTDAA